MAVAKTDFLSPFSLLAADTTAPTLPLTVLAKAEFDGWLKKQPVQTKNWLTSTGFEAAAGQLALLPGDDGTLAGAVLGSDTPEDMWTLAALPASLPRQYNYRLSHRSSKKQAELLALGWALGAYRYDRYLSQKPPASARLALPAAADSARIAALAEAITLVRTLITTPANDLGPEELVQVGLDLAKRFKGKARVIRGEDLLKENYPAVYEVGKGSERAPCLLDLRWGNPKAPRLTLVGKGVVFDTGGYDIKPSAGMLTMKKDMGGAAHALALALLIMQAGLNVNLRVLIPAVENSISGRAFRPSDIIPTRSGQTIEIGNTDAEGRVILADCLFEAASEKPVWLLDFATLTGARNVALGTEIPVFFSTDDKLATALSEAASAEQDPIWRLPLWQPYWRGMKSKLADMNSAGAGGNAGAITAALFLQRFVADGQSWAHFDFNAYNPSSQPGRPEGGEAMALRACFTAIEKKFRQAR